MTSVVGSGSELSGRWLKGLSRVIGSVLSEEANTDGVLSKSSRGDNGG